MAESASTELSPTFPLPAAIPRRGGRVGRLLGRWVLALAGWRFVGVFPDVPRFVLIVAPHTSNWDFVIGFSAYLALDLEATWFGKHTIFTWPFGVLLRRFGGIPVKRESREASQMVERSVEEFRRRERMLLALAPEGTRRKVTAWKSGFHRIAVGAGVPIVPVALDYRLRRIIIGEALRPTGDWERDLAEITARYEGITACRPEQF